MFEALEKAVDWFFTAPVNAWVRFADKYFEYQYKETTHGVFGMFDTPEKVKTAAKKAVEAGYTNLDAFSPFPVHGLEHDLGYHRSRIPYITFVFALLGTTLAFTLQTVIHEQVISNPLTYFNSYPLNIGGKPSFSWPAMVPVMFELTVLLGGLSTVAGFLALSRIPKASRKPLHPDLTNDRFALWIPADSNNYSEESVKQFFNGLDAKDITVVKDSE